MNKHRDLNPVNLVDHENLVDLVGILEVIPAVILVGLALIDVEENKAKSPGGYLNVNAKKS